MPGNVFKQCPKCGSVWESRALFLADAEIHATGYQVNFEELEAGLFIFNHVRSGCGTTIAIPAGSFCDLYDGPIFEHAFKDSVQCDGHCLRDDDLEDCDVPCECAYVRHVLQVIRGWEKETLAQGANAPVQRGSSNDGSVD
ncbi:MAG: hypothetical protein K9N51_04780 [Candidatus Pacebacteria bacterium]|nr:hypothetical protein [Candidatus Paceibacterota bacterium]